MGCSMSGFPAHHQLPELTQTHVHQVSDAIQSSHPLLSLTGLTGQAHQYLINQIPCRSLLFEVTQSCLTLSDLMDRSLPGSSVHGIFQARVLGWGAIAFSRLLLGKGNLTVSFSCLGGG